MIFESIKMVLKVFKTNKLRTFLTMLGVIIGIFSITMIFAISDATQESMYSEIRDLSTSTIDVSLMIFDFNRGQRIDPNILVPREEILSLAQKSPNIDAVSINYTFEWKEITQYYQENKGMIHYDNTQCTAISQEFFDINEKISEKLLYGRLFTKLDEEIKAPFCILREDLAMELFGEKEILGKEMLVNGQMMIIIGIMKDDTQNYNTRPTAIYILDTYATNYMKNETNDFKYTFMPANVDNRQVAINDIKLALNEHVTEKDYYIQESYTSYLEEVNVVFNIIELVFIGIAGLSLLVGGIGIMNIMLVSVNERIKEIGIRMSLGANSANILIQFLIEGVVLTLISGLIGILLAVGAMYIGNWIIAEYMDFDLTLLVNLGIMIKTILFCGGIGVLFGIYPAIKASKLNPIEALRSN